MKPLRLDYDGVPLFSSLDIEDYGLPEHYGYEIYRVIASREVNLKTDYKYEQNICWKRIHRYNRDARFKFTLLNLLGEKGNIPNHVLGIVQTFLQPDSPRLWEDTRRILKHYRMRKYYVMIPMIIYRVTKKRLFNPLTNAQIENLLNDFKILVSRFNQVKSDHSRVYFPNIKFICLKLLNLYAIQPNYKIPMVLTSRRNKVLNILWDSLI